MSHILIYSGRFQPFGPHHFRSYQHLKKKFPNYEIYIATSNKTDVDKSPLNFIQKKKIIEKYGIPSQYIVQVKNPYHCIEITSRYELDSTYCIFALGEKDSSRIHYNKKDGKESYFKKYNTLEPLQTILKCSYVYTMPNQYNSTELLSSSKLRNILPTSSKEEFTKNMGWYDTEIHSYFNKNITESFFVKNTDNNKSIQYIHSNHDLTFNEVLNILHNVCTNNIKSYEKIDGQNANFSVKNGQIVFARSKEQFKNPLTVADVKKWDIGEGYVDSISTCMTLLSSNGLTELSSFFENGKKFINCEIVDPQRVNVINYDNFKLFIHSIITIDDNGNIIKFDNSIADSFLKNVLDGISILPDTLIEIPYHQLKGDLHDVKEQLLQLLEDYDLTENNTIMDYYKKIYNHYLPLDFPLDVCEKVMNRFLDIKHIDFKEELKKYPNLLRQIEEYKNTKWKLINSLYLNNIETILDEFSCILINSISKEERNKLEIHSRLVHLIQNDKSEKVVSNYKKLLNISSIENIVPFEGTVFIYDNIIYKMTGSFRYVNQILAKEKYNEIN